MIPGLEGAPPLIVELAIAMYALAVVATLVRVLQGPTLPDRVVALDLLGFLVVGLVGLTAILTHRPVLLGVALVAAIILFLGTAAFAIYLERRARP